MKKYIKNATKPVKAAEGDSAADVFEDALNAIEDDFDYAIGGLEKISQDGYPADAKEIAEQLKAGIDAAVASISAILAE